MSEDTIYLLHYKQKDKNSKGIFHVNRTTTYTIHIYINIHFRNNSTFIKNHQLPRSEYITIINRYSTELCFIKTVKNFWPRVIADNEKV